MVYKEGLRGEQSLFLHFSLLSYCVRVPCVIHSCREIASGIKLRIYSPFCIFARRNDGSGLLSR